MEHPSSSKSDMFQDCLEPPKVSVEAFGRTSSVGHRNSVTSKRTFLMSDACARLWDKLDALYKLTSIDAAFDHLDSEPYADSVVQAYFSMYESDSDSGSEVDEEEDDGTASVVPSLSANLTAQTPSVHPTPDLSDFVTSCNMSEFGRGAVNEMSRSIKSAHLPKPQFPQFRKRTRQWTKHSKRPITTPKKRHCPLFGFGKAHSELNLELQNRSSKVAWDMVLLYKIDDIPKWAVKTNSSSLRHHHSVLLYEQKVDHKDFTGLIEIKRRMDEREKLIDRIVNECGAIILVQEGKRKGDRILKLLFPFESLMQEAEIIELRKTLRPGIVRLNTGRFASDERETAEYLALLENDRFFGPLPQNAPPPQINTAFTRTQEPESPQSPQSHAFPLKSSIAATFPYLTYKAFSSVQSFWTLFYPPFVDENRHSDHFRVKFLADFEGACGVGEMTTRLNFFKPSQRNNLVHSLLTRNQTNVNNLIKIGGLVDFFPPNDSKCNVEPPLSNSRYRHHTCVRYHLYESLKASWSNPVIFLSWDPSEEFRFYYGEKHAMYFAWFHFYIKFLWIPTVFGIMATCYGIRQAVLYGKTYGDGLILIFDNEITPWFTLGVSIWTVLFLECWTRQESILAHTWNVSDFERGEQIRPQWRHGRVKEWNPITQQNEFTDPRGARMLRRIFTSWVVLVCVGVNAGILGCVIIYRSWAVQQFNEIHATVASSLMSLVFILVLSALFERVAKALTDFDNYRTESGYQDALILKNFLLAVVNSFASLFYVGVVKSVITIVTANGNLVLGRYSDDCQKFFGVQSCMLELMLQMLITFMGIVVSNQLSSLALPRLLAIIKRRSSKSLNNEPTRTALMERDIYKPTYTDDMLGFDYISAVIQFGFITLFSCAFPLAPLLAVLSNVLELRIDAYKLLVQYRRPFSSRAQGIGYVQPLLHCISSVGVITNGIVIAFASSSFKRSVLSQFDPESHLAIRILFVVAFEHFVGSVRISARKMISPVPKSVRIAVGRRVYRTALETIGNPVEVNESFSLG
ncbi:Anoctamin-6 [Chytriomyces hyalinus]|nr:Anoctamin-6 [Chytriomyces hyalinus]